MKIKLSKLTYSLSEAIVMDIDYENKTTELITIEDPSKSLDVIMHVVDSKTNEDMSYTMGTIDVTIIDRQTDQYALSEPIVERIDISPEDSFHFTSDLNERLYLSPGKFDCFLTDQDAESNHLFVTILFDNASVDTLYAIAIDPHQGYSRREWAMDWLRNIYPQFRLDLPFDEEVHDIKAGKEVKNKVIAEEFSMWWQKNKNTINVSEMVDH